MVQWKTQLTEEMNPPPKIDLRFDDVDDLGASQTLEDMFSGGNEATVWEDDSFFDALNDSSNYFKPTLP